MANLMTKKEYEVRKKYCREICIFNSENANLSYSQYVKHWNSGKHFPSSEEIILAEVSDTIIADQVDNFEDVNVYINSYYGDMDNNVDNLTEEIEDLNLSERNTHFFLKRHQINLPRNAIRDLRELITDSNFIPMEFPSEYGIEKIDKLYESYILKLDSEIRNDQYILFLSINEAVKCMLKKKSFQNYILLTNGKICAQSSPEFISSTNFKSDVINGEKFQSIIQNRRESVLYISLIIF